MSQPGSLPPYAESSEVRKWLLLNIIILLSLWASAQPALLDRWEEEVATHYGPDQETYRPCTAQEMAMLREQAAWMNRGQSQPPPCPLTRVEQWPDGTWLIEPIEQKGWGLLLCRPRSAPRSQGWGILEIPHPLADRHTSTLGLKLFERLPFDALVLGGCHRRNRSDGRSDLAHTPISAFMGWHQGLASSGPQVVMQLHGFEASKARKNMPMPPDLDFIVADGSGNAPDDGPAFRLFQNLKARPNGPRGILAGPTQPWMLATTNSQVQHLRKTNPSVFVHLELNSRLRQPQRHSQTLDWLTEGLERAFKPIEPLPDPAPATRPWNSGAPSSAP